MSHLYTLGYACWTPDAIDQALRDRDAVLVDVRRYASSKKPGFAKGDLRKRFGRRYHHLQGFGNENFRGGPVRLHHPAQALRLMRKILLARPAILMCGCKDAGSCHRSDVAEYIRNHWRRLPVEHLRAPAQPGKTSDDTVNQLTLKL